MVVNRPSDEADREMTATPRMIHSVSSFVVKRSIRLTSAIPMVTGSVNASLASAIAAASSRPKPAMTTDFSWHPL
jgi:hypothetical protein